MVRERFYRSLFLLFFISSLSVSLYYSHIARHAELYPSPSGRHRVHGRDLQLWSSRSPGCSPEEPDRADVGNVPHNAHPTSFAPVRVRRNWWFLPSDRAPRRDPRHPRAAGTSSPKNSNWQTRSAADSARPHSHGANLHPPTWTNHSASRPH